MDRELFRPVALGIYWLTFLAGVVGALILPTMSLFFADEVGVSPFWVGIPYAGMAIASIVYNQVIGEWSDKLSDRRWLMVILCVIGALTCAVFALSRHYWLTCVMAIGFLSLAMVSFSQILAYSLEYAERRLPVEKIALFNALVRAQIAFAWVAGPPAGFFVATRFGFTTLFVASAALFALVAVLSLRLLPALGGLPTTPSENDKLVQTAILKNVPLLICLVAFSIMWGVNSAYLISLPLHMSRNLAVGTEWVGWIMGATAALEVPVMLAAGYLAMRLSPLLLVRAVAVAGFILYAGVYWAELLWQLFALQLANAVFVGILAGLGVSVVQAMLPGRAGSASALYTNTTHVGMLLSSVLIGTVAEAYGYRSVFLANMLLVVLAGALFFWVRAPDKK